MDQDRQVSIAYKFQDFTIQQRQLLPIYQYKKEMLYLVENHQVVIICAETGSGKTTRTNSWHFYHVFRDPTIFI